MCRLTVIIYHGIKHRLAHRLSGNFLSLVITAYSSSKEKSEAGGETSRRRLLGKQSHFHMLLIP